MYKLMEQKSMIERLVRDHHIPESDCSLVELAGIERTGRAPRPNGQPHFCPTILVETECNRITRENAGIGNIVVLNALGL
jgi:hypothetical protein